MGTNEILEFLENNKKKWYKTYQLKELLKEKCGDTALKKLRRWNFVKWRSYASMDGGHFGYEYKYIKINED